MEYSIIIILFVAVISIYFINKLNIVENEKDTINLTIFNGLSLFFILIFIYYSIKLDVKKGLFTSLIIWCLFVAATPITNATLLVSVPLKNLFKIDLDKTQWIVSFVSLCFIFYSYYNFKPHLKHTHGGRLLLNIIDSGSYSIFVTSIIGSVSMAYLLNEMIDYVIYKKVVDSSKNILYSAVFIISFIMYFVALYRLPK